jgi:pimeloyl-ACP methyl ester carboxylesterase
VDRVGPLGRPRRLQTTAGNLIYSQRGEGPVLLFVQGLLANRRAWDRVVPALATRYRCVTVEWPLGAHPEPMRADANLSPPGLAQLVIEVLDLLGLSGATLVGNDSGGVLAQLVIAERPDLVEAAVLIACDAFECFPPGIYKHLFRGVGDSGSGVATRQAPTIPCRVPLASRFRGGDVPTARRPTTPELGRTREYPARHPPRPGQAHARILQQTDAPGGGTIPSFTKPVLVVWAGHDRLFPAELGVRLATAFPNSQLETVRDSATFVSCDQPAHLAELIDE